MNTSERTKSEVSIIVPAYNEAGAIRDVVSNLITLYPDYEIIVVDDGSTDGTGQLVENLDCRLIRHKSNRGYGASWKTGVRNASSSVVCFFDGDNQFDPLDVKRSIDTLKLADADMVIGQRTKDSSVSFLRLPGKFILAKFADYIAGEKIPDLNCGLRTFRKDIFMRYLHIYPNGFSASTTSTLVYYNRKFNIEYIPIKVRKRIGTSSARQLRDGTKVLILMLRLMVLFEPLKVFLPLSVALLLFSMVYSIIEVYTKGLGIPVLGAIVFIGGLLTFLLGILSDQISSLRLEKYEYKDIAE